LPSYDSTDKLNSSSSDRTITLFSIQIHSQAASIQISLAFTFQML